MCDPVSLFKYLQNEEPMDSALNSAHSSSRRADRHMKYVRYDEAIKCHSETVNLLKKAIAESTIPKNVENLQLQCKYHENIQQIIGRQKREFSDFVRRNGLIAIGKARNQTSSKENREQIIKSRVSADAILNKCDKKTSDDNKFFSSIGDLKIDEKDLNYEMVHVKKEDCDEEFMQ